MGKITPQRKHLIAAVVVTVLWMGLIFWFSAQNADDSSSLSAGLLRKLLALVVPGWKQKSTIQQLRFLNRIHTLFRKLGHFTEYAVLGSLLTLTLQRLAVVRYPNSRLASSFFGGLLPVLLACGYAVTDELHQRLVAGRSCELRDVCIDTAGAALGTLLMLLGMELLRRWKRKKEA